MDRRDGGEALGDRAEVRARRVFVVGRVVAVDAVPAAPLLVRLQLQPVDVDPLAQTGNGGTGRLGGDVDVQDRALRDPVLEHALDHHARKSADGSKS